MENVETSLLGTRPLLLLGRSGMLGTALREALSALGRPFVAPRLADLDLTVSGAIEPWLDREAPFAVVNAAAYTDVARAEAPEHRDEVMALNREAPRELAGACAERGLPLVHVSTDYVFDGLSERPYREEDPVAPLQVYGRSKLEGERAVFGLLPSALVVRTSTLFGPSRRTRPHYIDAVLGQARQHGRLDLVRLPVSSPTYAPDLARAILRLLDVEAGGLVHFANRGACSRIEFAREAVRLAGLAQRVEIVERADVADRLRRPAYSVLDTALYSGLTGDTPRPWQEALAAYVERSLGA